MVLDFDPTRAPSLPRAAATVIVMRPSPASEGLEVFCVHRNTQSSFLGGAVVFPGGKVDAQDGSDAWAELATPTHPRAGDMATDDADGRALAVAACRETLEEAAIVPTTGRLSDDEVLTMRADLASGRPLSELLRARRTRLALDTLVPWARWVTPEAEARRFDARFFLLALPDEQRGVHDDRETTMSFWASPKDILERFLRGEIFLAPPTTRSLEMLAEHTTVESALALASEQSLLPVCPRFVADAAAPYLALPGDPSHDVREKRVAGKTRFVLRDARFVSEDP